MKIAFRSDPPVIWDLYSTFSGELAFDVGANGGDVASLLAERFENVIAYEPCAESFTHLAEIAPPVIPRLLALSDHPGEVELIEATNALGSGQLVTGDSLSFSWGAEQGRRTVSATTLDRQVEEWGVPDFVKIDTEGHEVSVIRGGWKLFAENHPTVLIEVHAEQNGPLLTELLLDYDLERIDHPGYHPSSWGSQNHFYFLGR